MLERRVKIRIRMGLFVFSVLMMMMIIIIIIIIRDIRMVPGVVEVATFDFANLTTPSNSEVIASVPCPKTPFFTDSDFRTEKKFVS
jgi:hypothetical protein